MSAVVKLKTVGNQSVTNQFGLSNINSVKYVQMLELLRPNAFRQKLVWPKPVERGWLLISSPTLTLLVLSSGSARQSPDLSL